jgi:hypothetical protein
MNITHLLRMNWKAILVFLLIPFGYAKADTVYSFTGIGAPVASSNLSAEPVAFQLTVPSPINPTAMNESFGFTFAQLDSSTNINPNPPSTPDAIYFYYNSAFPSDTDLLQLFASNGENYIFYFPSGAFDTDGIYQNFTDPVNDPNANIGTLDVSEISNTPEPSTWMLLLCGMVSLYGLTKWQAARQSA